MAVRITTKMMQATSLRNLNTNKSRQEKLTNQMSTGKKITRPSDDPVIAIRSLKLNSSLDKIDQYYEKNASDAESWLELTESALSTVNNILTNDIRNNIIGAKSSYATVKDREAVITHLRKAMEEIYSAGNSDSGGRSIFTGYRTDMPLTLTAPKNEYNRITEQFTNDTIDKMTFVYAGDISTINEGNFQSVDVEGEDFEISSNEIYRKRLAYGNLDLKLKKDSNGDPIKDPVTGELQYESNIDIGFMSAAKPDGAGVKISTTSVSATVTIDTSEIPNVAEFKVTVADDPNSPYTVRIPKGKDSTMAAADASVTVKDKNGASNWPSGLTFSYGDDGTIKMENKNPDLEPSETASIGSKVTTDAKGKKVVEFDKKFKTSFTIEDENIFASGSNDAYMSVVGDENKNKISYIAETGELLFGDTIAERFKHLPADTELRVSYDKSDWKKGDLDPVHYFYTEREGMTASGKEKIYTYNENFLDDPSKSGRQIIEYDIGNNQALQVNTTADEAFSHALGRDVEEVISMLEEYGRYQGSLEEVEKLIKSGKYDGDEERKSKLTRQKEALGEAMTRVLDKINKRCDELVKDCDGYFAETQLAATDCGARLARLRLVQNRLEMQQTNFGELVSDNEDADYTDLVIQLKSIEMTYQAALSSISYTMQTSLLDFIR